jgi:acyl-CoA thioester hydrolase
MFPAEYINTLDFEVRDYECDLQGVVNNAVYQHYLEHARHKWLESIGLDFAKLHEDGIDLMVARIEIDYKFPLRSRDNFVVQTGIEREGRLKLIFNQGIFRKPDNRLVLLAKVIGTALRDGRPSPVQSVWEKIEPFLRDPSVTQEDSSRGSSAES